MDAGAAATDDPVRIGLYEPRPVFLPFHCRDKRFAALVAHRRCGKTVACINELIERARRLRVPEGVAPGRFAYIGPLLGQAKEVGWDYLRRFSEPLWTRPPNESELWVEIRTGNDIPARIRIHGADNIDRLRGAYLDGVVLDEYGDMSPSLWGNVVRPMLADRGGWGVFIGTPKGRNHFWQVIETAGQFPDRWYRAILPASLTGILQKSELDDARRDMTPEQFAQEFECSFDAAIMGSYFGADIAQAEFEGRIGAVEPDPALPVHCAWDLGIGDATSIWLAQFQGPDIHVIDHFEASDFRAGQIVDELNARASAGGFKFGHDFVPHDAKVREWGTGKTRVETLLALGRKPSLVADHGVDDGINAARLVMHRVRFDRARCAVGLEALRQYRRDYDEKRRAYSDKPRHDWTSHAADAFRYLAVAWRQIVAVRAEPLKPIFKPMPEMMWWELEEIEAGLNDGRLERL